jgi:hypothetical protein
MDVVVQLLRQTYAASGEGITEQIQEAEFALMLAKAISYRFMHITDDPQMVANYEAVCNVILPSLSSFLSHSTSLFHMTICYQIARRLSIPALPSIFAQNPDLLYVFFHQSLFISESISQDAIRDFQRSTVKFCSLYFYRHPDAIPADFALDILNSVVWLTRPDVHPKVLGRCVQFLKHAMSNETTFPVIIDDLPNFSLLVFLPLFALSESDLQEAAMDPCVFVRNFHAMGTDTSDPRSFLFYSVLSQFARTSAELARAFVHILRSFLAQDSPAFDCSKYSACLLFSSVALYCPPELAFELLPLLHSPSFIVRAGGLLGLQRLPVPPDLFPEILPFLGDESLLVQYYAAHCIASILERLSPLEADQLREAGGPVLLFVIQSFFRLLEEFQDRQFIELFEIFVAFFGRALFDCAVEFAVESYAFYQRFAGGFGLSALATFVGMMGDFPDLAAAVVEALLSVIVETIGDHLHSQIPNAVELVGDLIAVSPSITELHWRVLECFTGLIAGEMDELWVAFRNLVIRDPATAAGSLSALFEMASQALSFDVRGPLSFLSALVMAVRNAEGVDRAGLVRESLAIAIPNLETPQGSALVAAAFVCDASIALEAIGEGLAEVLAMWLECATFQTVLAVAVTAAGAFGTPELFGLLARAVRLLLEELEEREAAVIEREVRERLVRAGRRGTALQMFEEAKLLEDFARLMCEIREQNQGMFEELQARFERPIPAILEGLQNYITGRDMDVPESDS